MVGITLGTGLPLRPADLLRPRASGSAGPAPGLVFALAIYDKITPGDAAGRPARGRHRLDHPDGEVGGIGGIQEKIAGAEDAGATVFLVPAANCGDLAGVRTDMTLVRVAHPAATPSTRSQTLGTPGGGARVPALLTPATRRTRTLTPIDRRPAPTEPAGGRAATRPDEQRDALVAALVDLERHVGAAGWDAAAAAVRAGR